MKHYNTEELELYRHGEMSVLGRIICAAHVKECPECTKRLAELEEDDHLIRKLRKSIRVLRDGSGANTRTARTQISSGN